MGVLSRSGGRGRSSRTLLLAALALAAPAWSAADTTPNEFFETSVRPILVERCGECHGPTGKAKGGLRLVSRASVLKGGDSGPAAVPGKPDDSLIVQAIAYVDEPRMPPSGKLDDAEVKALRQWVALGLPWPETVKTATPAAPADGRPAFRI